METNDKVDEEGVVEEDLSILDDSTDWKAKAQELEQKRREDGIRSRERNKALKDQLTELKSKPETKPDKKESTDSDLIEKAFFRASQITDPEVMQLAKDFAKRTGDPLDVVIDDELFKAKAEKILTSKANTLATDTKNNRSNTTSGRNTVDYWLAKGEHPPRELGSKLAQEYVAAKRNQGKNLKVFYND